MSVEDARRISLAHPRPAEAYRIMTGKQAGKQGQAARKNANAIEKKSDAASRQDDPVTIGPTRWEPANTQITKCDVPL
jgi:hypothetical protein